MNDHDYKDIVQDSSFIHMVNAKRRFAVTLTIVVLVIYAVFMAIATFAPHILAQPIGNSHITVGVPLAALIIIACWIITACYVYVTNQYFDKKVEEIKKEYHHD